MNDGQTINNNNSTQKGIFSTKIRVSIECSQKLEQINHDGTLLFHYLKGIFEEMPNCSPITERPSGILKFLESNESINQGLKLENMPATEYFKKIINKKCVMFDNAFSDKLIENKNNIKETWSWFSGFFEQEGLKEPLIKYKKSTCRKRSKKVGLS